MELIDWLCVCRCTSDLSPFGRIDIYTIQNSYFVEMRLHQCNQCARRLRQNPCEIFCAEKQILFVLDQLIEVWRHTVPQKCVDWINRFCKIFFMCTDGVCMVAWYGMIMMWIKANERIGKWTKMANVAIAEATTIRLAANGAISQCVWLAWLKIIGHLWWQIWPDNGARVALPTDDVIHSKEDFFPSYAINISTLFVSTEEDEGKNKTKPNCINIHRWFVSPVKCQVHSLHGQKCVFSLRINSSLMIGPNVCRDNRFLIVVKSIMDLVRRT